MTEADRRGTLTTSAGRVRRPRVQVRTRPILTQQWRKATTPLRSRTTTRCSLTSAKRLPSDWRVSTTRTVARSRKSERHSKRTSNDTACAVVARISPRGTAGHRTDCRPRPADSGQDCRLGGEHRLGPRSTAASRLPDRLPTGVQLLPRASRKQWLPGHLRDIRRRDDRRGCATEKRRYLRSVGTQPPQFGVTRDHHQAGGRR